MVSYDNLRTYIRLIKILLDPIIQDWSSKYRVIYTMHHTMVEEAKNILQTDHVYSLSNAGILSEINRAQVVMAPAGISTTYECLAYQTPIMFLPEQHDGNFSNYHRLAVYSGDVQRFRKHFAEALICYREGQDRFPKISDYYVRYEGILSNPPDNTLRDMQRSLGLDHSVGHPR